MYCRYKFYHLSNWIPRNVLQKLQKFTSRRKFSLKYSSSSMTDDLIVTVKEGKLRGATKRLLDGSPYFSFKGIPYAQPPIGKLRFKDPLPPKPYEGIYEAKEHGHVCPQYDMSTTQIIQGNENCLFLNVYTRSLSKKSPVMVYIHGGAYMSGSGDTDTYGPEFILQHDVILVTMNYRLEVLGFLCLNTPEVPGNAGIKDQVAALRWVKTNIAQFGGDPENITIFGESAGAAAVTLHMISPLSKGLFHKAVAQSGVCFSDWATEREAKKRAFLVGKILGKETSDTQELLEFLQSVPAVDLLRMTFKTILREDEKYRDLPIYFAPVVENSFNNVEPFLIKSPVDMVLSKDISKVPLIIGFNSREGYLMLQDKIKKAKAYNNRPDYFIPREVLEKIPNEKVKEIGSRIMKFYFGDNKISNDTIYPILDLQTDVNFAYNAQRFVHLYSECCPSIYMYEFCWSTDLNVIKTMYGFSHLDGASHADDLFYFFYNVLNKDFYEEQDNLKSAVHKLTKMWTDFAKTGNPTPDSSLGIKWPQYTSSRKEYLVIDEQFSTGQYAHKERMEFWNKIYCDAGLPCITKSNL